MSDHDKTELIEHFHGSSEDFGFRIRWRYSESWADVEVFEVAALCGDDGQRPEFERKGAMHGGDTTENLEEAEPYLSGYIKWDGCLELAFSDHMCGGFFFAQHILLMEFLWKRSRQIMKNAIQQDLPLKIEATEWKRGLAR